LEQKLLKEHKTEKLKLYKRQMIFAQNYRVRRIKQDLNRTLTAYVDLKSITSTFTDKMLRKKKQEMKELSIYYRMTKKGSAMTYLSLHILMFFLIFVSCTIR
jgi:hypothetical protein